MKLQLHQHFNTQVDRSCSPPQSYKSLSLSIGCAKTMFVIVYPPTRLHAGRLRVVIGSFSTQAEKGLFLTDFEIPFPAAIGEFLAQNFV